jgi:hypothetical protein
MVLAAIQLATDDDKSASAPTTFGEHMENDEIVPDISPIPHRTSRVGSSQIMLASMELQSKICISGLDLVTVGSRSHLLNATPPEHQQNVF